MSFPVPVRWTEKLEARSWSWAYFANSAWFEIMRSCWMATEVPLEALGILGTVTLKQGTVLPGR